MCQTHSESGSISGLVLDSITRRPIAAAHVRVTYEPALSSCSPITPIGEVTSEYVTGSTGRFTFVLSLPTGSYTIHISADGCRPYETEAGAVIALVSDVNEFTLECSPEA